MRAHTQLAHVRNRTMELLERASTPSTSEAYAFHALRIIDISSHIAEKGEKKAALLCTIIKCFEILAETIHSITVVDDAFAPLPKGGDKQPGSSPNTRLTVAVSICVLALRLDAVLRESAQKTHNSKTAAANTSLVRASLDIVRRFKGSARFGALCQLFAAVHTDMECACVLERFNGTANWLSLNDLNECVHALAALPKFCCVVRSDDADFLQVETWFLEDANWSFSKHSSFTPLLPLSVCSAGTRSRGKCERPPDRIRECAAGRAKQTKVSAGHKRRRGTQRRKVLQPCNAQAVYGASGEQKNSGSPPRFRTRVLWKFTVSPPR